MSCYAAGWTGYAKIGGSTLPFISGDVSQSVELITVPNIGTRTTRYFKNFMKGKRTFQGNVSFVLFKSYLSAVRKLLNNATSYCSFSSEDGGFEFSPAGNTTYRIPGSGGSAAISNLSLRSSAGGAVEGSVAINSTNWDEVSAGSGSLVYETAGLTDDNNFIPWYDVNVTLSNFADSNLVNNYTESWSFTIQNEIFPLFTLCNTGSTSTNINSSTQDKIQARTAKAMRYGMMTITGEIKYWSPTGDFNDPTDGATLTLDFGSFDIILNNLVFINDNTPNSGANSPVLKTIQFQALAGCDSAPIVVGQ